MLNATKGRKERIAQDRTRCTRTSTSSDGVGRRRRHRRRDRPEGHDHRRHAVRPAHPVHAGVRWTSPAPVIEQAIEPETKTDQEKLGVAIQRLRREDPTFACAGRGHRADDPAPAWASCTWRSRSTDAARARVEARVGRPQVAYRETPRRRGEVECMRTRSRPAARPVRAAVSVAPRAAGARRRVPVRQPDRRRRIPREFVPAVEAGIRRRAVGRAGGLPGGRLRGDAAGRRASTNATRPSSPSSWRRRRVPRRPPGATPRLLEPVMAVEVTTPEDYLGDVIGDLHSPARQMRARAQRGNAGRRGRWCR